MAAKKTSAPAEETSEDLFAEIDEAEQGEAVDLLDELSDEDGEYEAWRPEEPAGVQGTVKKVGTRTSDYDPPTVPWFGIETREGQKLGIAGFHGVLRRELEEQDPHVGDLLAVKFFGTKVVKSGKWAGKNFFHYRVAVRRAAKV
jgi:hypothetical protein